MLVHGGMAQNVGPILEMVTEKYLLRCEAEWAGRDSRRWASSTRFSARCERGDVRAIGAATTRNFFGPLQTIIPWASNYYTETLIAAYAGAVRRRFLGLLDAGRHVGRRHGLHLRAAEEARGAGVPAGDDERDPAELQHALPFAMEPVVYDFAINEQRHACAAAC